MADDRRAAARQITTAETLRRCPSAAPCPSGHAAGALGEAQEDGPELRARGMQVVPSGGTSFSLGRYAQFFLLTNGAMMGGRLPKLSSETKVSIIVAVLLHGAVIAIIAKAGVLRPSDAPIHPRRVEILTAAPGNGDALGVEYSDKIHVPCIYSVRGGDANRAVLQRKRSHSRRYRLVAACPAAIMLPASVGRATASRFVFEVTVDPAGSVDRLDTVRSSGVAGLDASLAEMFRQHRFDVKPDASSIASAFRFWIQIEIDDNN